MTSSKFLKGDIADYTGSHADIMVTLRLRHRNRLRADQRGQVEYESHSQRTLLPA